MNVLRLVVGLTAFLLMVLVAPASAATTRHVTNCNSSGPGSLPAVFAAALDKDTIVFDLDCTGASAIVLPFELEVDGIHMTTTLGRLEPVSYIGSGRYQATLTSSTTPGRAMVRGTINKNPITSFARVRFR